MVGVAQGVGSSLTGHFDVRIAMGAEQALQLAAGSPGPDVVFIDADAPGTGIAICQELRRGARTGSIPIVVTATEGVPGSDEMEDIAYALLVKPVDEQQLLGRLAAAVRLRASGGDPDDVFEAGSLVGEHCIERKLGSGAFGDVYAAVHRETGERVAVKILARRAARQPDLVARFVAEVKAANRIRQRNIIQVSSFGVHAETRRNYFVMELLDGQTLREHMRLAGRLSLDAALPILRQIADGLDAAHAVGVTHRDLKPDNVFVARAEDGARLVKILDFGIAKLSGDEAANRTRSGVVLGTPRYMSPEQARGRKASHQADVYALGVIVHEMLTGQAPFSGPALDVLIQHATDAPPRASSVCADVPPELDAPILAMLAKRPENRPATAGAAIAALAAAPRREGVLAG
jgi:eukaryotic-like serine/threonine-protein kinase